MKKLCRVKVPEIPRLFFNKGELIVVEWVITFNSYSPSAFDGPVQLSILIEPVFMQKADFIILFWGIWNKTDIDASINT